MLLTVLGTATPYPRPDEPCSGYLLQSEPAADGRRTSVWLDAGTGTFAELQRRITLDQLDAVVVSHRHADHSADLLVAYYALRFSEHRPSGPIPLIAPEGMLDRLAAYLGPNSVDELPRVFEHRPMSGFGEASIGSLRVEWGPVQHGVPAFGLTVEEDGRRFAYSGDSAPCLSLEEIGERADLFLVECGYDEPVRSDAVHHTPEDAGRSATAAGAARLVLTHRAETLTVEAARERASAHFDGGIDVAVRGLRVEI
ncbi:MBL fold metallo-hydrolase [Herbiconiux sp. CPCC 205716]|uniref:MBL fold metallo-hydrolase n=1 Tax=Herbiconiux gentiana TaxID=2970912 RepID=A0ABT2GI62_9MICO|nr:MBL fold metallo-hydrolase [Herbiconiux gentiana]MCS5715914.1 MBL fold metallo-hydrolase [Herbiconiux gentiana]